MKWITELTDWWATLPDEWAFLFLLPFFVAAVAFAADWAQRRPSPNEDTARAARGRGRVARHARRRA